MSKLVTKSNGVTQITGRKSYLSDPDFVKEFIENVEVMFYPGKAAEALGVARQTVGNWLNDGEAHIKSRHADLSECDDSCDSDLVAKRAFLVSVKRAQAEFTRFNTKQIKVHTTKNWMASAWLLERTQPDEFGLKARVEHTGKDGGPITHKVCSPDQIQRALNAAKLTIETEQDENGTFIPVQSE